MSTDNLDFIVAWKFKPKSKWQIPSINKGPYVFYMPDWANVAFPADFQGYGRETGQTGERYVWMGSVRAALHVWIRPSEPAGTKARLEFFSPSGIREKTGAIKTNQCCCLQIRSKPSWMVSQGSNPWMKWETKDWGPPRLLVMKLSKPPTNGLRVLWRGSGVEGWGGLTREELQTCLFAH